MEDGHAKTWEEVVNYFGTDPEKGLSPEQVKKHQEKYGPNGKFSSSCGEASSSNLPFEFEAYF
jgi:hypothetical protein